MIKDDTKPIYVAADDDDVCMDGVFLYNMLFFLQEYYLFSF